MMRSVQILFAALAAVFLSGCAGYRVGPVNGVAAQSRAVSVDLFSNKTFEPRLSEQVAFALRRKLQADGAYRLETSGEGDIVVSGSITEFVRTPLSFEPTDILTPRDYQITLRAEVTAIERGTGKIILQQPFTGMTSVRAVANREVAERQAEPLLAEDLARNITAALTEGSW